MNGTSCYHQSADFMPLNLEVNRLKFDVTDIKTQNAELITMVYNISKTMLEMTKKYDMNLKVKDNEIVLLKQKVQQFVNSDFVKDEISETNDNENSIEIETESEAVIQETISDVENDVERRYSNCSFSTESDNDDISSQEFEFPGNSHLVLKTRNETTQVDRQIINRPCIDEWTVVTKKQKDRVHSKKIQKQEVTYPPGLEVANGWTHLHLYNVRLGTTEKTVLAYIKKLCATSDCTVVLLKTREEYASFKIGVPVEFAERVLMKENWTGNIRIKPWKINAPPRKVLKNISTDKSKIDEKNVMLITNQNSTVKKTVDNTSPKNSKTDEKEKTVPSTKNLPAKKIVKNISTINPKTEEKEQKSTQNRKDVKSETLKPKRKSLLMTYF